MTEARTIETLTACAADLTPIDISSALSRVLNAEQIAELIGYLSPAPSPADITALVRAARAIGTGPDDPADKREWIRLEIDLEKKLQPFRGIADG